MIYGIQTVTNLALIAVGTLPPVLLFDFSLYLFFQNKIILFELGCFIYKIENLINSCIG